MPCISTRETQILLSRQSVAYAPQTSNRISDRVKSDTRGRYSVPTCQLQLQSVRHVPRCRFLTRVASKPPDIHAEAREPRTGGIVESPKLCILSWRADMGILGPCHRLMKIESEINELRPTGNDRQDSCHASI